MLAHTDNVLGDDKEPVFDLSCRYLKGVKNGIGFDDKAGIMAIITLNNKENIKNLICFNTCPNIITVEQTGITSTFETIRVNVDGMIPTSASKQSRIIVNGYAINGTDDIKKVSSRRFFRYGTGYNNTSRSFAAISIVNALKSIPQLVMNYNIQYVSDCVFEMTAKNSGSQYDITFETDNITNLRVISSVNGSTNDNLTGTYFSRIYLDLYYNNNEGHRLINSNNNENDFKYLTTLQKEYYKDLFYFVKQEYSTHVVYPPADEIFSAFHATKMEDVKVLLLGQDPYHGFGQAHGLCFSVQKGIKLPPSLQNIYKEIRI